MVGLGSLCQQLSFTHRLLIKGGHTLLVLCVKQSGNIFVALGFVGEIVMRLYLSF